MRKPKYVSRTLTVTRVTYMTNQSNETKEAVYAGSLTRREALENLREDLETEDSDLLVTQVMATMVEDAVYKVEQGLFIMVAESDISVEQFKQMIDSYDGIILPYN